MEVYNVYLTMGLYSLTVDGELLSGSYREHVLLGYSWGLRLGRIIAENQNLARAYHIFLLHFTLLAMDDVYQYTAEAVKANKNSNTHNVQTDQEEEEDPLVNAFNNFGFGRRWSNLVDSVKKQVHAFKGLLIVFFLTSINRASK